MNRVQTLESNWGASWENDGMPVRLMAEGAGQGRQKIDKRLDLEKPGVQPCRRPVLLWDPCKRST